MSEETMTPAQVLELLAELREARTKKLGLVRNGRRDLALTSLINELDNRVMEIPAATLRAQAEALGEREAEVERLRRAVANVEELALDWRNQAWANDAAGAPRSAADTLKVCVYLLNKALIPTQEAQQ